MGDRQHGALHASQPEVHLRELAEDKWTVSNYDWSAGVGAIQAGQGPRDVSHGTGHLRDCVSILGICGTEVCQREVDGEAVEEGGRRQEGRSSSPSSAELMRQDPIYEYMKSGLSTIYTGEQAIRKGITPMT